MKTRQQVRPARAVVPPQRLVPPQRRGSDQETLRLGGLEWARRSPRARRVRRRLRRARRATATIFGLAVLGGMVFAGLMLISPSVSSAPALARALDRTHYAAFPAPQPPRQFTAALLATAGWRPGTETGAAPVGLAGLVLGHVPGGSDRAAAELSQWLAGLLYLHGRSGLVATGEQALLALKLQMSYSRAAIVRMYAQVMYFGHGYYGLAAASCGYFGRWPTRLTWGQAAMLDAVAAAPATDDPFTMFANAREGEASVLHLLVARHVLTRAQAATAFRQRVHLIRRAHATHRSAAARLARCASTR
jgi:membrane peptidoglycan carboxypeptidase